MSKLIKGVIDLTKIKEGASYEGKNGGKYISVDIWVNDEVDKFGNNVGIKQSIKNGNNWDSHYIGNAKSSLPLKEQTTENPF